MGNRHQAFEFRLWQWLSAEPEKSLRGVCVPKWFIWDRTWSQEVERITWMNPACILPLEAAPFDSDHSYTWLTWCWLKKTHPLCLKQRNQSSTQSSIHFPVEPDKGREDWKNRRSPLHVLGLLSASLMLKTTKESCMHFTHEGPHLDRQPSSQTHQGCAADLKATAELCSTVWCLADVKVVLKSSKISC